MNHKQIAQELIRLESHDLEVRERLLQAGLLSDGYNPDMEKVHKENAQHLREIIALIGWPTISKVGPEASNAAWLIIQHAIGEPDFMKACYQQMTGSSDDINPQNIAYLYDRICYFEGRPQKYGTQYDDDGLYPVVDKNEVNVLRQELNLKPRATESIIEFKPSNDSERLLKDPKLNQWRKKVGWI